MVTYAVFGSYIDRVNPYAETSTLPDLTKPNSGPLIATTSRNAPANLDHPTVTGAPELYWPFRLPKESKDFGTWRRDFEPGPVTWPGGGPGYDNKVLEVEACRIVKAIVVPYSYDRIIGRTSPVEAQHHVGMKAHLVIGYTVPREIRRVENPIVVPTINAGVGYQQLGEFIGLHHPLTNDELGLGRYNTIMTNELNSVMPLPPDVMNAICWLQDKSRDAIDRHPFGSSADDEMDLCSKQQCLTWTFPQLRRTGDENVGFANGSSPDGWWMRSYQITKAIRVRYMIERTDEGGQPIQTGDILIGYSGSGDV